MDKRYARALALSAFLLGLAGTCAQAVETRTISGGGTDMFSVHYLEAAEHTGIFEPDADEETGEKDVPYTLNDYIKSGVDSGVQYWADILGAGSQQKKPVDVYVHSKEQYQNASAGQINLEKGKPVDNNNWSEAILSGRVLADIDLLNAEDDKTTRAITYNGKPVDRKSVV